MFTGLFAQIHLIPEIEDFLSLCGAVKNCHEVTLCRSTKSREPATSASTSPELGSLCWVSHAPESQMS